MVIVIANYGTSADTVSISCKKTRLVHGDTDLTFKLAVGLHYVVYLEDFAKKTFKFT